MTFTETPLAGASVIGLERYEDERGSFARSWCRREFREHALEDGLVQCNISSNRRRGTLRGLHFQAAPREEAKLVRCTRGRIFDVIVDLRESSPTFAQWYGVELSPDNGLALYVPKGFAHGFQTLTDDADVFYQMTEVYAPALQRGIRWDDPSLRIAWPLPVTVISSKDRALPALTELLSPAQPTR